jgi:P-type Cu2+ transporter
VHEMHGMSGAHTTNAAVHSSHNQHAGHSAIMFRDKFWLSLALTLPVVFWSAEVQHWLGYHAPVFPGSRYVPAILGTIIFVYAGRIFVQGARGELSARQPGMMTLISLAIVVAFAASLAATLGFFQVDLWWELSTLISVMLLGHWLEIRAVTQARGALSALATLLPDSAERITESGIEKVPVAELRVNDVVLVRPGSRVPADGVVVEGTAEVDESLITGESRAIPKAPGSAVVGGTVAAGGSLRVRVRAIGEETTLSGIMRLVAAAQASGSRAQALADRAADFFSTLQLQRARLRLFIGGWRVINKTPSSDRPPYSSLLARMRLGLQSRWRLRFQQRSAHAMVCS